MNARHRLLRRATLFIVSSGMLLQTASCNLGDVFGNTLDEANRRSVSNFVSDLVFFLLDNAFVRLTT